MASAGNGGEDGPVTATPSAVPRLRLDSRYVATGEANQNAELHHKRPTSTSRSARRAKAARDLGAYPLRSPGSPVDPRDRQPEGGDGDPVAASEALRAYQDEVRRESPADPGGLTQRRRFPARDGGSRMTARSEVQRTKP